MPIETKSLFTCSQLCEHECNNAYEEMYANQGDTMSKENFETNSDNKGNSMEKELLEALKPVVERAVNNMTDEQKREKLSKLVTHFTTEYVDQLKGIYALMGLGADFKQHSFDPDDEILYTVEVKVSKQTREEFEADKAANNKDWKTAPVKEF